MNELSQTTLSELKTLFDETSDRSDRKRIADRMLKVAENQSEAHKLEAETEKLKAKSTELIAVEMQRKRAELYTPALQWVSIAALIAVTIICCIFGVTYIEGYWSYWSAR